MARTLQKALDEIITQTDKLKFSGEELKTIATISTTVRSNVLVQDWTAVAQNTVVKSAEILLNLYNNVLHIQAALDTTTAHTGTRFVVQTSASDTGDEDWDNLCDFVGLVGTAATDLIENNPLEVGATSITLTGHALTVKNKRLFIKDATIANSEIVLESTSSANAVVILDGTANAHAVNTGIFNIAMADALISIPVTSKRIRVVVDNSYSAAGSTLCYKLKMEGGN